MGERRSLGLASDITRRGGDLTDGFQPRRNLIERLLNPIQLYLSGFCELLNSFRSTLQVTGDAADDLAASFAQKEYPKSSQQHSQAAQAIRELPILVHPRMDPASAA